MTVVLIFRNYRILRKTMSKGRVNSSARVDTPTLVPARPGPDKLQFRIWSYMYKLSWVRSIVVTFGGLKTLIRGKLKENLRITPIGWILLIEHRFVYSYLYHILQQVLESWHIGYCCFYIEVISSPRVFMRVSTHLGGIMIHWYLLSCTNC